MHQPHLPLWPLPLSIAVLLLGAVHLAWWLSMQAGTIPVCNPYWDGCTSISRAARHGLANHLFRLVVLPVALLHLLNWWLGARWLRRPRPDADSQAAWLLVFGAVSSLALATYATFLGSEGEAYRLLRRYGVTLYFGCGFLAQLMFLRLAAREGLLATHPALDWAMRGICLLMLAMGVAFTVAKATLHDEALRNRLENALEWQLGLLLVVWFVLQALAWRGRGLALQETRR